MICITTTSGPKAFVELQPPDPGALATIKGIPHREWMARKKCWAIPARLVPAAIQSFSDGGYRVSLNGEIQRLGRLNPFPDLAAAMSPDLWKSVAAALEEVLDPETGGDRRLFNLLQRTRPVDQVNQRRVAS